MRNLKTAVIISIPVFFLLLLTGCTETVDEQQAEAEKPLVIATLFPQYDFVRQVAGDKVTVSLLLPPGVEPHSYEPTPRDIADIQKADMFVYTGEYMEPWAERIITVAEDTALLVVDTSRGIELMDEDDHHHHEGDHELEDLIAKIDHIVHKWEAGEIVSEAALEAIEGLIGHFYGDDCCDDHDHEYEHDAFIIGRIEHIICEWEDGEIAAGEALEAVDLLVHQFIDHCDDDHEHSNHHGCDHDHGGKDPHFWLDPLLAQVMVDHIVEGLIIVDPDSEGYFRQNGEEYKQQLTYLHEEIDSSLAGLENRTILYGGHFAFGYFAARYNLEHVSPYAGFAPDAEPTPGNIAELIDKVRESNARVIYYEELIEPKVARVIAEQTGAEMVLLHGAHNVTTDEMERGITYIQIMEENLAKLLKGLK